MEAKEDVKRLKQYDTFIQMIITDIYKEIERTPKDGTIRAYVGTFHHNNNQYDIDCEFRLKGEFFQILKLEVKLGEKTIYTTVAPRMGKTIHKEILLN